MAANKVSAERSIIAEWAPFIKLASVSEQELIEVADRVHSNFLSAQKGYIKRQLIKRSDTEYADIIYWESDDAAYVAGQKVSDCGICAEYFELMDLNASEQAGAGFSYYSILKQWQLST